MQEDDRFGMRPNLRVGQSDDGHIEDGIPQTLHDTSESESITDIDNEADDRDDDERILQLQARIDAGKWEESVILLDPEPKFNFCVLSLNYDNLSL